MKPAVPSRRSCPNWSQTARPETRPDGRVGAPGGFEGALDLLVAEVFGEVLVGLPQQVVLILQLISLPY